MPGYRKPFEYELFTPQGTAGSGQAVSAILPAKDGQVGVLGGRAPLAVMISGGLLVIEHEDGQRELFYAAQGFAQTREDRVTVVVEECTPLSQVDAEAAFAELERLGQRVGMEHVEPLRRAELMEAARRKFNLAQRFRRGELK